MVAADQTQFDTKNFRKSDALIIRSLGHPIRLKILKMLDTHECHVKQIWECLDMEQAVISQHLAVLKNCGIINGNRRGAKMLYTICNPLAQKIVAALM